MTHKNRKIYFALFWVVLVASFIFFSTILILMANGYHLNNNNFTLEKTGMVVIDGGLNNVNVSLNGKEKIVSLPAKFTKLFPGKYEIIISKDGFHGWNDSFDLEGGQAVILNNIILYAENPKISDLGTDEKLISRVKNSNAIQMKLISIRNNELRYNSKFITRFSQPILGAIYDTQTHHIYVQLGREIHVLEEDGSNNTLITKTQTSSPVTMSINNNELSFIENNKVFTLVLW